MPAPETIFTSAFSNGTCIYLTPVALKLCVDSKTCMACQIHGFARQVARVKINLFCDTVHMVHAVHITWCWTSCNASRYWMLHNSTSCVQTRSFLLGLVWCCGYQTWTCRVSHQAYVMDFCHSFAPMASIPADTAVPTLLHPLQRCLPQLHLTRPLVACV